MGTKNTQTRFMVITVFLATLALASFYFFNQEVSVAPYHIEEIARSASVSSATSGSLFSGDRIRHYQGKRLFERKLTLRNPTLLNQKKSCDNWSVVTTIMPPSNAVTRQAKLGPDWCTVIVLDKKSPANYTLTGLTTEEMERVTYLDISGQEKFGSDFSIMMLKHLSWNHFGRKNVGYLYAISQGAKRIWDFDDDNILLRESFVVPGLQGNTLRFEEVASTNVSVFNAYSMMGASHLPIWPRGMPLDYIKSDSGSHFTPTRSAALPVSSIGIIQSLANNDPDVDAIYRLVLPLPVNFQSEHTCVAVPDDSYAPLNAQATLFFDSALWLLFLPTSVHGRVSDIWRGYIGQRLLKHINKKVFISSSLVSQYRNTHNFLADMQSEQDLYFKSGALVDVLDNITLVSDSIAGCLEEIYIELYNRDFLGKEDIILVQDWILALESFGYIFPINVHEPENTSRDTVIIKEEQNMSKCLNATNLQLFLPLGPTHHDEFQQQLLRSLLFFWPPESINMLVILDQERGTKGFEQLNEETKLFHDFDIKYSVPSPFYCLKEYCKRGHDRQQLIMFWADNFTQYEYIGFLDTDTFFITPVTQDDFFEGGKPVINAFHGRAEKFWRDASETTKDILGQNEQFRCMSYFPVIVKTMHLRALREFVEKKHGVSFNSYFRSSILTKRYSQFNIICNYLWYHHQNEYAWHIQVIDKKNITTDVLLGADEKFNASQLYPKPRVSIHTNYHYLEGSTTTEFLSGLMAMGYCYDAWARQSRIMLEWCGRNEISLPDVNPHMFNFEKHNWQYHPKVNESFQNRQSRLGNCQPHIYDNSELEKISLDLSNLEGVEYVTLF